MYCFLPHEMGISDTSAEKMSADHSPIPVFHLATNNPHMGLSMAMGQKV